MTYIGGQLVESREDAGHGRSIEGTLLSVVVPCYNEEDVISLTHQRLVDSLGGQPFRLQVLYVDDGSTDRTGTILAELAAKHEFVKVVSFSRNFGQQPAVSAGLRHADGGLVAVIDADLQDPPEVILEMITKWRDGMDVVYGVRRDRKEGRAKKAAYDLFYRLYRVAADMDVPLHAGDFALLDRRVVDVINDLPERNRFVRGLRAWTGFQQTGHEYSRAARAGGEPKYSFIKLVKLASDGIFNFSTVPLTLVLLVGILTAFIAAVGMGFVFAVRVLDLTVLGVPAAEVPGFTFVALAVMLFGGIQLVSIGILGEYIGRIYKEVKQRPPYIVSGVSGKMSDPPGFETRDRSLVSPAADKSHRA